MSRVQIPFVVDDISALARSLSRQLADAGSSAAHTELLNMLARSAGFRNFQHYRAQHDAHAALERPAAPPPPEVNLARLRRVIRAFGPDGTLLRWPSKLSEQTLCTWVMWSRVPPHRTFTERELNGILAELHAFGDHALIRRELVNHRLMTRPADCSAYQRIEREPPPEALALIRHLGRRGLPARG
jgi:hypothetical protein